MDEAIHGMHERLVDHLDGIGGPEERAEVTRLIASDQEWAKAWEGLQESRAAIIYFGIKQQVGDIHQEMRKELTGPKKGLYRRMIRPFLSVAAALILIIGGYLFYLFYTVSPEKIYRANYLSYELGTLRDANVAPSALEDAFRKKDHAGVLVIASSLDTVTSKDNFLAGISCMELKNYPLAKTYFKNILKEDNGTGIFRDESEYYLALTCIATRDYEQALTLLQKIRDEKHHPYHQSVSAKLIREVLMLSWK